MKTIDLLTAVAFLILLQMFSGCKPSKKDGHDKQAATYTCPMHPQILEDHPGDCPICGMALIKQSGQASEDAGVSLKTVLEPVEGSVIASIGVIRPVQKENAVEIRGEGYLDFDTRTFNTIAARFSGRIEKLYVKYAFQQIHKGQRIFDVYSPEMVTAQQDLVFVLKNSPDEPALINAAKQKLLLLGMTSRQLEQLLKTGMVFYSLPVFSPYEGHVHDMPHNQKPGPDNQKPASSIEYNSPLEVREGMYIEKGQKIFNVVDPHHLWAVIKIDPTQVANLKCNQKVKMTMADLPGKTITGKVDFIEPVLRSGEKRTSIRVYLKNMDHRLKVNSVVHATIQAGTSSGLWVPASVVLDLGMRKMVWLKQGSRFEARAVSTGIQNGDQVSILKGIQESDSLALDAHYLLDSEGFIKINRK